MFVFCETWGKGNEMWGKRHCWSWRCQNKLCWSVRLIRSSRGTSPSSPDNDSSNDDRPHTYRNTLISLCGPRTFLLQQDVYRIAFIKPLSEEKTCCLTLCNVRTPLHELLRTLPIRRFTNQSSLHRSGRYAQENYEESPRTIASSAIAVHSIFTRFIFNSWGRHIEYIRETSLASGFTEIRPL